ncbi:MAG: GNAT family N-acetyltransferase [bacterium]|nr:GNAT family N-acetyltransferase [bacterium]
MKKGNSIYLRSLTEDDFTERYLSWFCDPEVTRFLFARNITREDAVKHLRDGIKTGNWHMYAICEVKGGRHIGNIKIGPIDKHNGVSDLVTVIGERDAWGRGYGREAVGLATRVAFGELGIRKLSASIDSRNIGSIKAYTAAGFEVETSLKNQYRDEASGELSDKVFFSCFNPNVSYV